MGDFVLAGDALEQFRLAVVGSVGLVAELAQDVAGGVVDQLEARSEVRELLVDRGLGGRGGDLSARRCLLRLADANGLLVALLLDWGRNGAA